MKLTPGQEWLNEQRATDGDDVIKRLATEVDARNTDAEGAMASYLAIRGRAEAYRQNQFAWRDDGEEANIFTLSNKTLGIVRSGIAFIVARTQEDIFGSKPWFAANPEGIADQELAARIQKHLTWKLDMAKAQTLGEQAVESCFHYGEEIIRTAWKRTVERYTRRAVVLGMVGKGGKFEPLLDSHGDYIEADAVQMLEAEPTEPERDDAMLLEAPAAAQMVAPDGTPIPPEAVPGEWMIDEEEVTFDGPKPFALDWRTFRCSPTYDRIEDAPYRGHVYDLRLSQIRERALEIYGPEKEWPEEFAVVFDKLKTESTGQKDPSKVDGVTTGDSGDAKNPVIACLDFEIEWDPHGRGDTRMLTGTLFVDYTEIFWVDFLRNWLPEGESLYTAIAVYKQKNTWCGRGWWELYEDIVENTDRLWNTMMHREGMLANPLTGVNADAIDEDIESVKFLPGSRVRLKANKRMADFLDTYVMPNLNPISKDLLQFLMSNNQLETGVTSSAQGGLGELPATNTATGIQSVLASGSTLHKRPAREMREGFETVLQKTAALLYANQDKDETFRAGDGENTSLVTLSVRDVRDLRMNVRLTMTRFRQREQLETAQTAIGAHQQYIALPEVEKGSARTLYLQIGQALGIDNAETVFRLPQPPPEQAGSPPVPQIGLNFRDLPTAAKQAVLEQHGLPTQLDPEPTGNEPTPTP